jgi:hypothetical protein
MVQWMLDWLSTITLLSNISKQSFHLCASTPVIAYFFYRTSSLQFASRREKRLRAAVLSLLFCMSKINIYLTKEIRALSLSFICYCNWLSLSHTDMTFVSIKGGGGGTKRRKCVSNRAIKRRRGPRIEKCNSSFVGNWQAGVCLYVRTSHCGICAAEWKEGWMDGGFASEREQRGMGM